MSVLPSAENQLVMLKPRAENLDICTGYPRKYPREILDNKGKKNQGHRSEGRVVERGLIMLLTIHIKSTRGNVRDLTKFHLGFKPVIRTRNHRRKMGGREGIMENRGRRNRTSWTVTSHRVVK